MEISGELKRVTGKFKKYVSQIKKYEDGLTPAEKTAFDALSEFWRRGKCDEYSKIENKGLIDIIQKDLVNHAANLDLKEALSDFISLCEIWYLDEKKFKDFQRAMGGREPKPIIGPPVRPTPEPTTPKPTPKPTPTPPPITERATDHDSQRIDYNNGYYVGPVLNGLAHGYGKRYWTSGEANGTCFEGNFVNGKMNGQGSMLWANGRWYEGDWLEDKRHGKGTEYNVQFKRTDKGDYRDGYRKGRGVMKWENGNRYEGTWDDDTSYNISGEGIYYYANGTQEHGKWINGKWVKNRTPDPLTQTVVQGMMDGTLPSFTEAELATLQRSIRNFDRHFDRYFDKKPSGLARLGNFVWKTVPYWPVISTAYNIFFTDIYEGFWSILWAAVKAFFFMGVLFLLTKWLDKHRTLKIILISLVAIGGVLSLYTRFSAWRVLSAPGAKVEQVSPVGKWEGSLNNVTVTLSIHDITGDNVSAIIHFPDKRSEKLTGRLIGGDSIWLKDVVANGFYDGEYSGRIVEASVFNGVYSNPKTKTALKFSLSKSADTPANDETLSMSSPVRTEPATPRQEIENQQQEQASQTTQTSQAVPSSTSTTAETQQPPSPPETEETSKIEVAPPPPREGKWTKVSISGFQMNLDRNVAFHFSNGQFAYFVLASHGDGYPVRKYDIAARAWSTSGMLNNDFLNTGASISTAPVIDGIAYMAGMSGYMDDIELKIMRYDMRSDAALPIIKTKINVRLGEYPKVCGVCAIGNTLVFVLLYNQVLTFNVGNSAWKVYKPVNGIVSNQCAMFNFGGKATIVYSTGHTDEFDLSTSKYVEKNRTSALASTSGFGYPVYGAKLGGLGYVLCLNYYTPQFREYNPANGAWRMLNLPVTGNVTDVYGFPIDDSRMFCGFRIPDSSSNPWQYYMYEVK
jgi:hypothetical protein